ncbi:flagellar FliL protein [Gammaproteobacteria bacterium]
MKFVLCTFLTLFSFVFSSTVLASEHGGGGGGGTYKELAPPFVVNLPDVRQSRFLQVAVAVSSPDEAVLHAVEAHAPLLRNNLIMLFTGQTKDVVTTREGREKLRADAEEVVNKALKEVGSHPIEALYFTSLVVQ